MLQLSPIFLLVVSSNFFFFIILILLFSLKHFFAHWHILSANFVFYWSHIWNSFLFCHYFPVLLPPSEGLLKWVGRGSWRLWYNREDLLLLLMKSWVRPEKFGSSSNSSISNSSRPFNFSEDLVLNTRSECRNSDLLLDIMLIVLWLSLLFMEINYLFFKW